MERYIVIQNNKCANGAYFSTTPENNLVLFEQYHITRFAKLAIYDGIWNYISEVLYKYGSTDARTLMKTMGYISGAISQSDLIILKNGRKSHSNNHSADDS